MPPFVIPIKGWGFMEIMKADSPLCPKGSMNV